MRETEPLGIWDVEGSDALGQRIRSIAESVCESADLSCGPVTVEEVLVFGSYGTGVATPGESDLDIMITTSAECPRTNREYSKFLFSVAEHVQRDGSNCLNLLSVEVPELDVLVYPWMERDRYLMELNETNSRTEGPMAYSFDRGKVWVIHP